MRQVPLTKLQEVFGADAVLYVTINQWGTQYLVLGSSTVVSLQYELRDLRSGELLWERSFTQRDNSDGGNNASIGAMIAAATVHALINASSDSERVLALRANQQAIHRGFRLLRGPYHPEHARDMKPEEN